MIRGGNNHVYITSNTGNVYGYGVGMMGELSTLDTGGITVPTQMLIYHMQYIWEDLFAYGDVIIPFTPEDIPGYVFDGWYIDAEMTILYTEDTMPAYNITLYGRWLPI